MTFFRLASRNVLRNRFRASLTILGVAVAIVAFVLLRTVLSAWNSGVEAAAKDRMATRHKMSFVILLPKHYIDVVRQLPGIKAATFMNWFGAREARHPEEFFANIAVEPGSFLEVMDEIVLAPDARSRWLENRQGAIVGDVLAKKFGWRVGDRVTLRGTIFPGDWTFSISGIYTATRRSVDRSTLWFHWDYLNQSLPEVRREQIGWITSRVTEAQRSAEIGKEIDRIFDEKEVPTLTMSERAMNMSFMGMISAMLKAVHIVSVVILVIMMLILGNTIAMGVRERTHEYGVLRAIGFSRRHIAGLVLGEAAFLGVAGGLCGLCLAYPIVERGMGGWLEENVGSFFPYFRIASSTAGIAFALALILAGVAASVPAFRAARLSVVEALRRVG